jgi:hypothetical protein
MYKEDIYNNGRVDWESAVMNTTSEEANQAGIKDRTSDWFCWKLGFTWFLSQAFVDKLLEIKNNELSRNVQKDIMVLRGEMSVIRRDLICEKGIYDSISESIKRDYQNANKNGKLYQDDIVQMHNYNASYSRIQTLSNRLQRYRNLEREWETVSELLIEKKNLRSNVVYKYLKDVKGLSSNTGNVMDELKIILSDMHHESRSSSNRVVSDDMMDLDSTPLTSHGQLGIQDSPYSELLLNLKQNVTPVKIKTVPNDIQLMVEFSDPVGENNVRERA